MSRARGWFDCYLRSSACDQVSARVATAPESVGSAVLQTATLPKTTTSIFALPGVTTFARSGKAVRRTAPLRKPIEVFGAPTVQATVAASGGWSRLVAVLTARTPKGEEIIVSAGGVPTKNGAQKVTIRLINQATYVPKGSRLTLTLASSSTAQSSANLLYLDLPMAPSARVRIGTAVLKLPGLRTPITK
jgi:predicted acyl esterase